MITKYLICYPGGAAGNFIACIIRTIHNNCLHAGNISVNGGCDNAAGAGAIFSFFLNRNKKLYPENYQAALTIANMLTDMEELKHLTEPLARDKYIIALHYLSKESIELFASVPGVKLVYINVPPKSREQVALNKVSKNYISIDNKRTNADMWVREIAFLLRNKGFTQSANLVESRRDPLSSPRQVKQDLISAWMSRLSEINYVPSERENIMVINFDDIMTNRDLVLENVSKFTDMPINDLARNFYDEYIKKQPSIEKFLTC